MKSLLQAGFSLLLIASLCVRRSSAGQVTETTNVNGGSWSDGTIWTPNLAGGPNNGGGTTYAVQILNTPNGIGITLDVSPTIDSLEMKFGSGLVASAANLSLTTGSILDAGGLSFLNNDTLTVSGNTEIGNLANNNPFGDLGLSGGSVGNFAGVENIGTTSVSGATLNARSFYNAGLFNQEISTLDIGAGGVANISSFSNGGLLQVSSGGVLNITGGGDGITDIPLLSSIDLSGNINVINGVTTGNGLGKLTSVEGFLGLANGQTTVDTPIGGTLTTTGVGPLVQELDVSGPGTTLKVDGDVDNSTAVRVTGGGMLNVTGSFINRTLISQLFIGSGNANIGSTLANRGTVTVVSNAMLGIGSGTFSATSGYQQLANGTLNELIVDGLAGGVINVNGSVLLDGTLDITLTGPMTPAVGQSFDIMNFTGSLSGVFATILDDTFNNGSEKWVVDYGITTPGEILLIAEANTNAPTPEPASLLLLVTGLLASGYVSRRRLRSAAL